MESIEITLDNILSFPTRIHMGDAGLDIRSNESFVLEPFKRKLVSTGLRIKIPYGYVGYIMSRSGLAHKHGVIVLNAPGVIDYGYFGEVKVNLINLGDQSVAFEEHERIAQLVIQKVELINLSLSEKLSHDSRSTRGISGHGSSGR